MSTGMSTGMSTDTINEEPLVLFLKKIAAKQPDRSRIVFLCIGSDRSTGDSYGPIVGSMLRQRGWEHVIGTLQQPCDAYAVEGALQSAVPEATVIAIDACLGKQKSVGQYVLSDGPLQPGAATGRRLPAAGDYSIAAIVNMNGPKAYWMLQSTSLYHVIQMAKHTVQAIESAWPVAGSANPLSGPIEALSRI